MNTFPDEIAGNSGASPAPPFLSVARTMELTRKTKEARRRDLFHPPRADLNPTIRIFFLLFSLLLSSLELSDTKVYEP